MIPRKNFVVVRASDGAVVNTGYVPEFDFEIQADVFGPGHFVVEPPVSINYPEEWVFENGALRERTDEELLSS
jgi:hypothetical protein